MKSRKTSLPDNSPSSTGREVDLLQALNAAAASLQRSARSESDVFAAFRSQINKLGLSGSITFIDPKTNLAHTRAVVIPPELYTSLQEEGLLISGEARFSIEQSRTLHELLTSKKPVFTNDLASFLSFPIQQLPPKVRDIVLALCQNIPGIFLQIQANNGLAGVLQISGSSLNTADIPALEAFANHIAIALENAHLFSQVRQAEALYRSTVEQSADGIVLVGRDGNIIEWNHGQEQITGVSCEQALGKPVWQLQFELAAESVFAASFKERIRAETMELLRTGEAPWANRPRESEIISKDGKRRLIQSVTFPIKVDGGFLAGSIIRDITEARQHEHETTQLLEAERKRRQEAETMRRAISALTSTLDLNTVLDAILSNLEQVLPYDSASILLLKDGQLKGLAGRGFPDLSAVVGQCFPAGDPLFDEPILTHHSTILEDAQKDPRFKQWGKTDYVRGWMGIPLVVRDQVLGYMTCDSREPGAYKSSDTSLAEAFAAQAALALEKAILFEEEGRRAAELEAVRQASLNLTASLDLQDVLDAILLSVLDLLPEVRNGHIFLFDEEWTEGLTFGAAMWRDDEDGQIWITPRPHGLTHTVAIRGEAILVPDMRQHPLYVGTPEDWKGAIIGLPLKIGQRVVGVMNVSYSEPRQFSEHELRLLRLLGDQAAIAIENARLFEQASLERRHLRLLSDIGRALSTSLEPDEILNRAVNLTCQALDGSVGQGFLYQPEEKSINLHALYSRLPIPGKLPSQRPSLRLGAGLAGWVAQTRQAEVVEDVNHHPHWIHWSGVDDGVLAAVSAPILLGDQLLGVITVLHQEPGAFNGGHLSLMQALCQEVGLALSNAQRYQQVNRRLAEITLIQDLAQIFNQRLELETLLDEVVEQLADRFEYPQVEIFLIEGEQLSLKAFHGRASEGWSLPVNLGIIGRVARTGLASFVPDTRSDPDYEPALPDTVSELAVPIFHGAAVVGVINIETDQPNRLSPQDRDLLQVLAGQLSIAFENALLYQRVRRHAEELEHTVEQRTSELTELYKLSQEIGYQLSYEDLLALLLRRLLIATSSECVAGCLTQNSCYTISLHTHRPLAPSALQTVREAWAEMLKKSGQPIEASAIQIKMQQAEDYDLQAAPILRFGSMLQAPVFVEDHLNGALISLHEQKGFYGDEQRRLLGTFAHQAAAAVQRVSTLLAAQHRHLESLVEHLPVGVLLLDSDFQLLAANPSGREILELLNGAITAEPLERLGSYPLQELLPQQASLLPVEIILDSPLQRVFEAQIRSIGADKQQWVLTVREVTEERENQSRIQSQERLATVGQLAAGIAHDFNNIMSTILVYSDLISQDEDIQQANRERAKIIQQQVQRASSLIRQILDFSRRGILEQSSLDLLPFVKELDRMLGRILPETIRLELSYQPGAYWVKADPTRLQQVFMNLALNARDAMPEGGRLHFAINHEEFPPGTPTPLPSMPAGKWVRIDVTDSGSGIPKDVQPHIFEPFFTTKPVGQGTGLGLAQVYGIVKQHDGFIDVKSQVGLGATFTIYLPALSVPVGPKAVEPEKPQLFGKGETVLVVEDNEATRNAMQALLQAHNFQVLTAPDGVEALSVYDNNPDSIHLVISDVVMPRMGGMALYEQIKQRSPDLPMLFITGHPMETDSQSLLEMGQVHWLQKPFNSLDFHMAVSELLNGKRRDGS